LLRGLRSIVIKEVKELIRDPKILLGMIIVPLIMFPLMGSAVRMSMQSAIESARLVQVAVVNLDQGEVAQSLLTFMSQFPNLQLIYLNASSVEEAVGELERLNATELLVIPPGFSEQVEGKRLAVIEVYSVFTGRSMVEGTRSSVVKSVLEVFKRRLSPDPFQVSMKSIVKGRVVAASPEAISGLLMSQYVAMPVTIAMMIMFGMQLAATSMASEKEEKTLETLLSLPINRFTILVGKLTGSVIVAAISALAYLIGFNYYMQSFTSNIPVQVNVNLAELGLALNPTKYAILGTSLFASLLSALALAVVLSTFAEDVRGAQALVGYLYPVLFIPMMILMFTDINALPPPLQVVLLAIPYSHPMLAAKALITEDYTLAVLGIIYVSAFTVAVLYLAAKFFRTEKVLTARLRLRRARVRGLRRERPQ